MTDDQHAKLNEVAVEVYKDFLKKYSEEGLSVEEEIELAGTCYGYMLALATLGYRPDQIGKEALSGVDKLMKFTQEERDDIYSSDSLGFTPKEVLDNG